jgi:hypothetical protein
VPYCDFNSHAAREPIPEAAYVEALLGDLDRDLAELGQTLPPLVALFIGGGTPSLFSGAAIARLLAGIRQRLPLDPTTEITLEANPGTADAANFAAYREAGVNRLSLGVQSLSADRLRDLGRIHGPDEARRAFRLARQAGFDNINLDLMYGLPHQNLLRPGKTWPWPWPWSRSTSPITSSPWNPTPPSMPRRRPCPMMTWARTCSSRAWSYSRPAALPSTRFQPMPAAGASAGITLTTGPSATISASAPEPMLNAGTR